MYGVRRCWSTVKTSVAPKLLKTGGAHRLELGIGIVGAEHGPAVVVSAAVLLKRIGAGPPMSLYAGPALNVLNGNWPTKKSCEDASWNSPQPARTTVLASPRTS